MPLSSVDNISSYLAAYMCGEYEGDPREMPEHVQIMLATLWATEKRGVGVGRRKIRRRRRGGSGRPGSRATTAQKIPVGNSGLDPPG